MKTLGACDGCGQQQPITFAQFHHVIGLLVLAIRRSRGGTFCRDCARQAHTRATLINLLAGWWSGPSLIANPIFLIRNRKEWRRVQSEFDSPATSPSSTRHSAPASPDQGNPADLDRLPWSHLLGAQTTSSNLGQRQLSPPMAIGALAALVLFVCLIGAITLSFTNGNNRPGEAAAMRTGSWIGLILSILTLAGCIFWEKSRSHRPDRAPDVLAAVVPPPLIFDIGRAHLSAFAFETQGHLRLVVVAQNILDAETQLKLSAVTAQSAPPLHVPLAPAEVAAYFINLPLTGAAMATLSISATTSGPAGQRLRFSPRSALSSSGRETLGKIAMAAGGKFSFELSRSSPGTLGFMDRLGRISVEVPAFAHAAPAPPSWRRIPLWTSAAPKPPAFAAPTFLKLLPPQRA
jgi:hypothetical protein